MKSMGLLRTTAALCTTALLVACGSAGQNNVPSGDFALPGVHHDALRKATLTVRVRVPKRRHHGVGVHYISAGTKGMTMAFTGPSTFTQVVNLTPSDPRCVGTPLVCTIAVGLAAGNYTVTVNTYDQPPSGGVIPPGANLLSTAHNVAFSVARGVPNAINLTMDGVPNSFVIGGFPNATAGVAFLTKSFSVTVKDAGGYTIVGAYSTPVTLTDSDASGATAIATAGSDGPPPGELLGSGDATTISYTGASIPPTTIGATAGSASGHGMFLVHLPTFVSDRFHNTIDEVPPNCVTASCVTTNYGGGFSQPRGVAVDSSGNIFVADTGNNAVKEIPPGCTSSSSCVNTLGGAFTFSSPAGVAVDGSGNVFVADSGNNHVEEILAAGGYVTVNVIGSGFSLPYGVAVDGSDNVFVADTNNSAVKEILAATGYVTVNALGGGFNHPEGVAVDGSGNVFVADTTAAKMKEIPPGCTSASCVITLGGTFFFNTPYGVAVDAFGNVYDADFGGRAVYEIPAGCTMNSCVTTIGGGFGNPGGAAILR